MRAPDHDWAADVHRRLKQHGITIVGTVPDAGLTRLLDLCRVDGGTRVVTLSTEEEGIGVGFGAWLGGERALLCMQSSGAGNCINALALPAFARTPCLMLVTMRGQDGEGNPAQLPMGGAVAKVFEAMGVACMEATSAHDVAGLFDKAAELAFGAGKSAAVLVAQSVIGVKSFGK